MYKETPEQGCLKELHHIFKSIFLVEEVRNSTTVVNLNLKKVLLSCVATQQLLISKLWKSYLKHWLMLVNAD